MVRENSSGSEESTRRSTRSHQSNQPIITLDPVEKDSSDNHRQNRANDKERIYVYDARDHIVEIYSSNLKCLFPEAYLDDSVMRFFTAYLLNEVVNPQTAKKMHVFDNYFHIRLCETFSNKESDKDNKVTKEKGKYEEDRIRKWKQLNKWFSGVDIFEKSYLIFPICQEEHWFVVIVCYPGEVEDLGDCGFSNSPDLVVDLTDRPKPVPGIIVMDSLGLCNRMITKEIRQFLDFEWRTRLTTIKDFSHHSMPQYHPKLPTQTNAYDCGIYTLAYLKAFALLPDKFYRCVRQNSTIRNGERKDLPKQLLDIVNKALVDCERDSIQSLIAKKCHIR